MRTFVLALAVGLLLAACGQGTQAGNATVTPTSADPGDETPVLQVEQVGGFLPVGADFRSVPQLTVYLDGRAIVTGPQILVYPGPALPNLLVHRLSEDDLDELRRLAEDAGLLAEPPEYGEPPVADASTTVVTLRFGEQTRVHEAYALGLGAGPEGEPALPGIGPEAEEARAALARFVEQATAVVEAAGEAEPYQPEAFALLARPVPADEPPFDPEGPQPTVVDWPLPDVDLAAAADCLEVDGEAAQTLRATLTDANELTRFSQDGQVYEVWARPLLPGAEGCPA